MRFLVKATIPVESGNALVRDPNFGQRMESLLGAIKPEAVYYTLECGQRTMYCVVNFQDPHQLPSVVEPLWLAFKADVKITPVMDQADMAKATPLIAQAARRF